MRLDHEALLLYIVAIIAYAFLTQIPFLFYVTVFYLLLATAGLLATIQLGQAKFVDVRNDMILATMAITHLVMYSLALVFGAFRVLTARYEIYIATIPLIFAYYVLVAIGEVMIYIALPSALASRYPKLTVPIYLFFAFIFAILHSNAYGGTSAFLLQPFVAAIINQYIFRKFKNMSGIVLGHAVTDIVITMFAPRW